MTIKITKWTVDKQEGTGGSSGHFSAFSAGFWGGQTARSADFSSVSAAVVLGPNLNAALDQVFHVPLDQVQMLLDVVEMLNGFVRPQTAGVPLVLGRADLFHRLLEVVSAEIKETDSCYKQLKVHVIPISGASKPGPQVLWSSRVFHPTRQKTLSPGLPLSLVSVLCLVVWKTWTGFLIPLLLFVLLSFTLLNLQQKAEKQPFKVLPETHIESIHVGKHKVL